METHNNAGGEGVTPLEIAQELADGAERARVAGDTAASLELAFAAQQYIELAKALGEGESHDQ